MSTLDEALDKVAAFKDSESEDLAIVARADLRRLRESLRDLATRLGDPGADVIGTSHTCRSVIRVPSVRGKDRHPTEKPIRLMQSLIESSSLVGDVVLDPFMGVGSTCVAAILLGRRAIGIELDPGYFEIAKERCIFATDLATIADRL